MASQKTFTKKQINDQIESVLADNTSQAISAADVRSVVKDYMTESLSAPLLIYSGIWRQSVTNQSGSDTLYYVKDLYYNPDFFQQQAVDDPANADNIYQANTTSIPGFNGDILLKSDDIYGLKISISVVNGSLASMSILEHATGMAQTETAANTVALFNTNGTSFPALTLTYNGAVRAIGVNNTAHFDLTSNADNSQRSHNERNTILSASPWNTVGYLSTGNNSEEYVYFGGIRFSGDNRIICENGYLTGSNSAKVAKHTSVQIYRIPGKN